MERDDRRELRGLALVGVSTLSYALLPVLGKLAYAVGVSPPALLAWRYGIAAAVLALLERGDRPALPVRLRLWGLGALFACNSMAFFQALETVPASVLSLVLYTYPVLVTLLAAAVGLEPLTLRGLLLAAFAFAGCALTTTGSSEGAPVAAAGVGWALLAALLYAGYVVASSRFGAGASARVLALHLAQAAAVVCIVRGLAGTGLGLPMRASAWLVVLAIALVPTVVATTTFLAGLAIVGPTRACVLASFEVVITLLLAFSLLGERLEPRQWAGAALILGAVVWSARRRRRAVP